MNFVSENIKTLWRASGLTQKEFAEQFGITDKAIWTYIHGRAEPNGSFLLKLCEHYSVDIYFLTERKIRVNGSGEIINRPDRMKAARELKKRAEALIIENQRVQDRMYKELARLITDLEQLSRRGKS